MAATTTTGAITAFFFVFLFSTAAAAASPPFNVPTVSFSQGFAHLFGNDNLVRAADDRSARLTLNRYSGSGFISTELYDHGFFSASVKLPKDFTAGVVVAFYTSNGDIFPRTHDELDFEFLGNVEDKDWRIQTNIYGNGSTARGREERYLVPFDPTEEAHSYSILWTPDYIIFYIDDVPIREVVRTEAMGGDFPSKPMSVYATIWDGSSWATAYGRIKINYEYEPFVSEFADLVLHGCPVDPIQKAVEAADRCAESVEELMSADFALLTPRKRAAMRRFRERYMIYCFCYDQHRYGNVTFPDCDYASPEHTRFGEWGDNKVPPVEIRSRPLSSRRSRRSPAPYSSPPAATTSWID
ncbi:putative xyloglucan endotransglucosylase/hydrolase protein 30 [Curcuma longa]|uniref:putative xyloglucan endotransglucosylase/hydrolase protein 30 n=1 Tax=Curcuma longa TaxID=136217 RepID=UPI003D9EF7D3